MTSRILGINSAYHEPAACIIVDGEIIAMAEEERFNRFRHGKVSKIDNSDDLPWAAAEFCLHQAGLQWSDVTDIGYSLVPELRFETNRGRNPSAPRGDWGTEDGERTFLEHNMMAREKLRARAPNASFRFLSHHECHAASAFLVSPFDNAAILVADGIGEFDSTWLGVGSGSEMTALGTVCYPHSIGFVWEKFSQYLGFDAYSGPGKMMGYACTSDPFGELSGADHLSTMYEIFRVDPKGTFFVDNDAFRFGSDDCSGLERFFGPKRAAYVDRYEEASIAAALQTVTNEVMVHLANRLFERLNSGPKKVTDLCLAGGVALNCVSNYELAAQTQFERIWIQPAANDAGTAIGAAALLHMETGGSQRPRMKSAYLGPGFSDDVCKTALEEAGLSYTQPNDPASEVAKRIEAADIVAWFQGRQEVGPRALGNRSIVCDPSRFDTRNRINTRVKYRESFRPFAPSVLPQALERYFELPCEILATEYMLVALPLKDRRMIQVLPAVIQENGSTGDSTSRIQLINRETNPKYAEIADEFFRLTDIPVILNTSFNIREPIVTTPKEAVRTFLRSSMDALVLGPFLAENPQKP